MKHLITILILSFLVQSCISPQRCARKYPPQVITKDSVVYKEVIKTVTVHDTVFIKADTVSNSDTVYINQGLIYSRPVFAWVEFANAKAQVVDSRLMLNLYQNDTAIARILKQNIKVMEKEKYNTVTIPKKEYVVKWYHTAAVWIAIPTLIALLVFAALTVIKIIM